jgi:toxin ParE1/3/4
MKIWMSPEAEQDLIDIFDYILQDNPGAAEKILDRIENAIRLLNEQPHMGRPGRVPKTRELVLTDAPFIIPYQVRTNRLEILRVYHSSRKWPDDFNQE